MFHLYNPYDNSLVSKIPYSTKGEVLQALQELELQKLPQRKITKLKRKEILNQLAQLLLRDKKIIASQITSDMGKPISESLLEVERGINTINLSAEECLRLNGEILYGHNPSNPKIEKKCLTEFVPLGLILCLTPFNFPINLALHKIAPAFATGNVIFFKPHPQTFLTSQILFHLCIEAGFPQDSIKLLLPDNDLLSEMIDHSSINCFSFTGGQKTANLLSKKITLKKQIYELGGNDPLILCADGDCELAVQATINHRVGNAGQRCNAAKIIYVHENHYEHFKKLLVTKLSLLKIGDPLAADTQLGPLVNSSAADLVEKMIQDAILLGAKVLWGNKRVGNIIHPTVLENLQSNCLLLKEEAFGPVIPLISFRNISEVIKQLKKSGFGLQAGLFTYNQQTIEEFQNECEVGTLLINEGPGFRAENFSFGGVKNSGFGREGITYAMKEFSTLKNTIL